MVGISDDTVSLQLLPVVKSFIKKVACVAVSLILTLAVYQSDVETVWLVVVAEVPPDVQIPSILVPDTAK